MEETETEIRLVLVVPRQHVKLVKTALEEHGKLDRTARIEAETVYQSRFSIPATSSASVQGEMAQDTRQARMRIPTTFTANTPDALADTLSSLHLSHLSANISLSQHTLSPHSPPRHPLRHAIHQVLSSLPPAILSSLSLTPSRLAAAFPDSYCIYPPLLVLPANAFSSPLWRALLTAHPASSTSLRPLWAHVASAMRVSHIAINAPIPLHQPGGGAHANTLRSPVHMTPLHGVFGTAPTAATRAAPSRHDLDSALWVSAVQNGTTQVWAPLFTMFSRGNVREKTRILGWRGGGAVVDMYAGIGYFAFSYRRAAAARRPVICFELNPWSVEGFRRGAARNAWSCTVYTERNVHAWDDEPLAPPHEVKDFYMFQLNNHLAYPLLKSKLKARLSIRHVNLGLLPRSRDAWRDAVRLVDGERGGWVHAHENVGVEDMESTREEVGRVFQALVEAEEEEAEEADHGHEGSGRRRRTRAVVVQHVERVKMYAPGVVHCVFDVWIGGRDGSSSRQWDHDDGN
ncbi:S-adenosylmethionine-dependent methyltransferase [Pleosporales sp. CAS-2024a]